MPVQDQQLLERLQLRIDDLKPRKDPKTVGYWRSDTIQACTACQQYHEQVKTHCYKISYDTCHLLTTLQFATPSNWKQKFTKFEEKIANPAAQLAILMRCSPEEYRWQWYENPKRDSRTAVYKRHLRHFIALDIQTHNKISSKKLSGLSDDAEISELVSFINPALLRCGRDGQKDIVIAKPVIAIHLQVRQPAVKVEIKEYNPV